MKRTPEQNRRLHGLLSRLGIKGDQKAALVARYTHSRTERSSEMSYQECEALINDLQAMLYQEQDVLDTKRKRVISHLKEAGFALPDGRADMPAIYGWVRRQKYKKEFNAHSSGELSELIHAAAHVRNHFLSRL